MMRVITTVACVVALSGSSFHSQVRAQDVPKVSPPALTKVKSRVLFGVYKHSHWGEVIKIDDQEMQVRCVTSMDENNPKLLVFRPIDVLAKGEVLEEASDPTAYRWQDVEKGDKVDLGIVRDDEEKVDYCVTINLYFRPKGKIPSSQKPDQRGIPYHVRQNIKNDIENGLDVEEDEIKKIFPFGRGLQPPAGSGPPPPVKADDLPDEYRRKLEANRKRIAEEKALKAKSADSKSDPKKDVKK